MTGRLNTYLTNKMEAQDKESVSGQEGAKDAAKDGEESEEMDPTFQKLLEVMRESLDFFLSGAAGSPWVNAEGKKMALRLGNYYRRFQKKTIPKAIKRNLVEMFLEKSFPSCLNTLLNSALEKYPEILSTDEKDLKVKKDAGTENGPKETNTNQEKKNDDSGSDNEEEEESFSELFIAQYIISRFYMLLINWTDKNKDFALACGEAGVINTSLQYVRILHSLLSEEDKKGITEAKMVKNNRTRILSHSLGFLHNTSKLAKNKSFFLNSDGLNKLLPYMKCDEDLLVMKTLFVLAHLIGESNNHLIMADAGSIVFLIKYIKNALNNKFHKYWGLSLTEMVEALCLIAQNDANKRTIGESDGIATLFTVLISAHTQQETLQCCKTLWMLAFDEENRKMMLQDQILLIKVREHTSSENAEIKKAAAGILWEVQGKNLHTASISKESQSRTLSKKADHIMISYQWTYQKTALLIRDRLQNAGYKVWIDVDQMGGSTLEAMAGAIENACIVLMTVCQPYKDSPNCRSEAEYTFQLQRQIIPLLMEHDFTPDGWMGRINQQPVLLDFKDDFKIDQSLESLLSQITSIDINSVSESGAVEPKGDSGVSPAEKSKQKKPLVSSWDKHLVQEWLQESNLLSTMDCKAIEYLDGKALLRLQSLRRESPTFFYTSIRRDLGIKDLFTLLDFVDELEKLICG